MRSFVCLPRADTSSQIVLIVCYSRLVFKTAVWWPILEQVSRGWLLQMAFEIAFLLINDYLQPLSIWLLIGVLLPIKRALSPLNEVIEQDNIIHLAL